ncbi:hypothetical protein BSKO_13933 [Bryopsis sp. KO-2023]|nr:hypothetical protein BSKO_13933 [Bryopsis sp. KO-2023]
MREGPVQSPRGDVRGEPNGIDNEEDVEEEEPRLKYQRLGPAGSDVAEILASDVASCLCVSERMLALGTHSGSVYLLSCAGDKVKHFQNHKQAVRDLCFDGAAEFIGSCSDDGSVVIIDLCKEESTPFNYNRPLKTITLDPRYGSRRTREFVTGGVAGKLVLSTRGWLGNRDHVLHAGEGPIHIARWSGNFIAWANDVSVKVYDSNLHKDIGSLERPKGTFPSPSTECRLFWSPNNILLVGWAHAVTVASVNGLDSGTESGPSGINIIAKFDVDGIVSGISLFSHDLAVLVYVKDDDDNGSRMRPELRILTKGKEEISSDALSIPGFELYEANDYSLTTWYPVQDDSMAESNRHFSQWWLDGEEPLYYVVSPKDVVVGRPRDENDRVKWLLQHEKYEKALEVARVLRKLDKETWDNVVDKYMKHLFSEKRFAEAAEMCPDLLSGDANRWERHIFLFAENRQLDVLSKHIPTENPTLKPSAYNMVLRSCIPFPSSHQRLFDLVSIWPNGVYSVGNLAKEVSEKIKNWRGDKTILMEVLAKLYIVQNMYDKALEIYLQLRQPGVFDFILQHALLGSLVGKFASLISLDEPRALDLLTSNPEEVNPGIIIQEIQEVMGKCKEKGDEKKQAEWRMILFKYMDKLVAVNVTAAPDHLHALLVELYADYDEQRLMQFLQVSHQYPLDQAYDICKSRGLVREQVYILSRMGNTHEALQLIIKELADIPQAIDFAKNQNDNELWDSLIDWAVGSAATTGDLLDHVGGHVDPLRVITRIPQGMKIWNLRQRLCQIIADYRTQTSLQEGCNNILRADGVHLGEKFYKEIRCAIGTVYVTRPSLEDPTTNAWFSRMASTGELTPSLEPVLENTTTISQLNQSSPGSSRDVPGVQLGFVADSSENEGDVPSERFKFYRKTSSIRYTDPMPALPSLVQ